jgi:hypothetical protein
MSSRPYIVNRTANTQPVSQQLGDEWFDASTNTLYKQVAVGGTTVTSSQVLMNINNVVQTTGEIRSTNNIIAFYSSDRKFKENIQDIPDALNKVSAIGGKTFDWTDDYVAQRGGEDGYFVQKSDFGVIAQDVQSVFPQAVRTREDGTLAVDYEKLVALSFAAIVELKTEIYELKSKNVKSTTMIGLIMNLLKNLKCKFLK